MKPKAAPRARMTGVVLAATAVLAVPLSAASVPPDDSGAGVAFEQQWEELIAAAQDEGALVTIGGPNVAEGEGAVFQHFADEFGLDLEMVVGSADEVVSRVLAERQQGIYSVDIAVPGGSTMARLLEAGVFAPLPDLLIHPEALDRSSGWHTDHIPWNPDDPDQMYGTSYSMRADANFVPMFYNTDNITEDDIASLDSWYDLLDPKYQGRIVIGDVGHGTAGNDRILGWLGLGGADFFERLMAEMDVEVLPSGSSREMADGLARGDWDFGLFIDSDEPFISAEEDGLPVALFVNTFSEGSPTSPGGNLGVFDQAPHPAAAQLVVNWLLSVEGQTAYNEYNTNAGNVALMDVPQGNIPDDIWARATNPNATFFELDDAWAQADADSLAWWEAKFSELGIGGG